MVTITRDHPLRRWRKSKKLTLRAAAERVGTVRQVWYGWESGRRRPKAEYMLRLKEVTEGAITADDFYPGPAEAELAARRAA